MKKKKYNIILQFLFKNYLIQLFLPCSLKKVLPDYFIVFPEEVFLFYFNCPDDPVYILLICCGCILLVLLFNSFIVQFNIKLF